MSQLTVTIVADGAKRAFVADGEAAVVVAAFRAWLSSGDCALPLAADVEPLEATASDVEARADRDIRAAIAEDLLREVFAGPAELELAAIAGAVNTRGATIDEVQAALAELVVSRKITVRSVGPKRRWRRADA